MKILMGTKNPGKIEGARQAFEKYFDNIEIEGIPVSSNVGDQPINEEILQGAKNRVRNLKEYAKENQIEADFYVSSEAGITNLLGEWIDINAVVIEDSKGFQSVGTSQGFPIPDKYIDEIKETELGKVMDKIFSGKELGKGKGGISFLTKDEVSRIDLTRNAFIMALTKHKVLYIALGDLNMKDFVVRLGAMYSGMSFADTTINIGAVYESLSKLLTDGSLEVSINPAGKISGQDIVDYVESRAADFEVVMVDYDSNAKGAASSDDSMYNSFGNLYEKLNELVLGGKLVFIGSQIKVSAWEKEIVDMVDVGESSRKQHTADCIIGIGRIPDCPNHVHAIKLSKNRRGEENVIAYAIRLNNARWKMIPRGVYEQLKGEKEKIEYTEGQIDQMIQAYNAQYKQIQQNTQRIMNNMSGTNQSAGPNYKGTPFKP